MPAASRAVQTRRTAAELSAAPLARVSEVGARSSAAESSRFVHFVRFTLETLISIVRNALILSCGPGSVLFGPRSHRHLVRALRTSTSHALTSSNLVVFHRPAELIFDSKLS